MGNADEPTPLTPARLRDLAGKRSRAGVRPVPAIPEKVLTRFERTASRNFAGSLIVVADGTYRDADEQGVFAAVYACQLIARQRWVVRAVLSRGQAGASPVMARVAVEHLRLSRAVTGTVMRDVNFGEIRTRGLQYVADQAKALPVLHDVGGFGVTKEEVEASRQAATSAARGSNEHYRYLALEYLQLVAAGRTDVLNALVEAESARLGQSVDRERLRGWLRRATKLGYLTSGTAGTASRSAGPNLYTQEEGDA